MYLIDSHCHLDSSFFDPDRDAVIKRAHVAGVMQMVTAVIHLEDIPKVQAMQARYSGIFAAVGIYPRYCKDWKEKDLDQVRQATQQLGVVAIGEIGLDYSWNNRSPRETQKQVLAAQLELASQLNLPVILHNWPSAETYTDTLNLVAASSLAGRDNVGILHHFTANYDIARRAIDLGLFISLAGPVTYPNAKKLPALISKLPRDRLVVETDAPCMAPYPYRGRRSEPAHIRLIAECLAGVYRLSLEEIARTLSANTSRLFRLPEIVEHGTSREMDEELAFPFVPPRWGKQGLEWEK